MNIEPKTLFRHGKTSFQPGTVYAVSDDLGHYFRAHGWAEPTEAVAQVTPTAAELDAEPGAAGATLQPHDAAAATKS